MSTEELARSYREQGYTQKQAEHLAKLTTDDVVLTPAPPAEESDPAVTRAKGKSAGTRSRPRRAKGLGGDSALAGAVQQGQSGIRAWAKARGIEVPPRGGIPKLVREMYNEEMGITA